MIVVFFHMAGTVPVFHDSLKSFNNVLLVSSPKFFIMSFVTPSGPGAFLHFNCLIASSTSSILIASIIQLSVGGWSCFCFSCSLACLVLSLDSFTLLYLLIVFCQAVGCSRLGE